MSRMRRVLPMLATVMLVPGPRLAGAHPQPARTPPAGAPAIPLVLDSLMVVDVATGHLTPAQRVVIVGHRIQAVGDPRTVRVPAGARVVPARGKYLIPGLWDMHAHNLDTDPTRWATYLTTGVTGVRDMETLVPLDSLHAWRRQVAAGTTLGPRVLATGPYITNQGAPLSATNPSPSGWPPQFGAATPDEGRRAVAWFRTHGADFVKLHGNFFTRATYFAIAAEARRLHLPFAGHVPAGVTMAEASDSGQHSLEHAGLFPGPCWLTDSVSRRQCAALLARLKRNDTWLTPTLAVDLPEGQGPETIVAPDYQTYQPDTTNSVVDVGRKTLQDKLWFIHTILPLHPPLLAGDDGTVGQKMPFHETLSQTDAERVGKLHAELELLVLAGLTPLAALQTATLNPAKYFGATDSLGTIAPGKLADLVMLDANPLADIHNTRQIAAVVADGRYLDRAVLDSLIAVAKQRADSQDGPPAEP